MWPHIMSILVLKMQRRYYIEVHLLFFMLPDSKIQRIYSYIMKMRTAKILMITRKIEVSKTVLWKKAKKHYIESRNGWTKQAHIHWDKNTLHPLRQYEKELNKVLDSTPLLKSMDQPSIRTSSISNKNSRKF